MHEVTPRTSTFLSNENGIECILEIHATPRLYFPNIDLHEILY